jgi:hypothetical protein
MRLLHRVDPVGEGRGGTAAGYAVVGFGPLCLPQASRGREGEGRSLREGGKRGGGEKKSEPFWERERGRAIEIEQSRERERERCR